MKKLEEPLFSQEEKYSIRTDLQYLESMKTDQIASYNSLDKVNINIIKKRKLKKHKVIPEPSCSSAMASQ